MNWITIGSIMLNLIGILVYLKVPEFIQSFFIKRIEHNFSKKMNEIQYEQEKEISRIRDEFQRERQEMEHDFQVRLDILKKHKEVLPILYEKIVTAESYYKNNYNGKSMTKNDLNYYAEVKNFITKNRFFMSKELYEKSRECEDAIFEYATQVYKTVSSEGEVVEKYAEKQKAVYANLNENISQLEEMIYEEINN